MKICIFTLGCKVNASESESLARGLKEAGHEVTEKLEKADLYIVNTCAVTAEAEKKSRQTAARIAALAPEAEIIYTGCACQKDPDPFAHKKNARLVTGVFDKGEILSLLGARGVKIAPERKSYEELLPPDTAKARHYVKVQDGCDNFCSYCIIPYLRGRSRSRPPESVKREIENAACAEVVLGGINLSAYRYQGCGLTGLMRLLKDTDKRVRLGSLEVNVIDGEFLSALAEMRNFAPHFHLSLQSGSDEVLKAMNRRYTAAEYLGKVELIRSFFPRAGVTTDIIAGFPSETEKNFEETLALVRAAAFSDIHCFPYSPRSGTAAFSMKDLPAAVKKERTERLLAEKKICRENFARKNFGEREKVVAEEWDGEFVSGYTGNYLRAYLKEPLLCGEIPVIIKESFRDGVLAERCGG